MGLIIGRFRKKRSTYEKLEELEDEIKDIEEFHRNTEQTQKKMVGRFVFISICVYLITALIFYFYFFPASVYERIIYIIPLLVLPILLILIKRILTWYYNRKLVKNQKKLALLKDEKKKILEEVMDKETYKVAQRILEKFAPEQVRRTTNVAESTPVRGASGPVVPATGLRYRNAGMTPAVFPNPAQTPINRAILATPQQPQIVPTPFIKTTSAVAVQSIRQAPSMMIAGTPLPLPRSILPKDRSFLDKMVDYLVGDGPSNRYALICKNCCSHNGMALKEEFDYLAFRCCYCSAFNPARKQRPIAPKLESGSPSKMALRQSLSNSLQSSDDSTDSDQETEPIIIEPHCDTSQQRSEEELQENGSTSREQSQENGGKDERIEDDSRLVQPTEVVEEKVGSRKETVDESIENLPFIDDSIDNKKEDELSDKTVQKD